MSRSALLFALSAAAGPAYAQSPPLDEVMASQRSALRQAMRIDCPPASDDQEIIVCGSRAEDNDRHRLPLASAPQPGAADRAGGEQRAALAIDSSPCTTVGRDQRCGGGLDVIGVGAAVARAVMQALANRD